MGRSLLGIVGNVTVALLAGALAIGSYQSIVPNNFLARAAAKDACESKAPKETPKIFYFDWQSAEEVKNSNKLDHTFEEMSPGDSIVFGNLELKATDARAQTGYFSENKNGHSTMYNLDCPGFVSFDVSYDGSIVSGGNSVEIVYGSRYVELYDGWPDFTIEDVLEETDLSSRKIDEIFKNSAKLVQQEYQTAKQRATVARAERYANRYLDNPELRKKLESCEDRFIREDETFSTEVLPGESKVAISYRFNECNSMEAFFPTHLTPLDAVHGTDVCTTPFSRVFGTEMRCDDPSFFSGNETVLHPGQKVYLNTTVYVNSSQPSPEEILTQVALMRGNGK